MDDNREACGRCTMTTVVDMADGDGDGGGSDPYGDERIEVDEDDLRLVSAHHVAVSRAKTWFDGLGQRLVYGR